MVVDGGGVLSTHAGPILVTPEVCVLTSRDRHLVPELGPEPVEGLSLGHGQGDLDPLHQHLDILGVREVSRVEYWFVVGIVTPEEDPAPGLGSEQHGYD